MSTREIVLSLECAFQLGFCFSPGFLRCSNFGQVASDR